MSKTAALTTSSKVLMIAAISVILVTVVFVTTQKGSGQNALSDAIGGGALTLTSVGGNYDALTQFMQNDEAQARQLLDSARLALEGAKAKLNSAKQTDDEYVLAVVDNYQRVSQASSVMSQGVDNLLFISGNLTDALHSYSQGDYEKASEQASYCLQTLTPLLGDFEAANASLDGIDPFYIPSGQRDELTVRIGQYRKEMEIYNQYVLLLKTLLQGKEYLEMNELLEEYLRQLQSALSKNDQETAQSLMQKISEILKALRGSEYQDAASLASQLNPSLTTGKASEVSQELRNRLRNLQGIDSFENYLKGLDKYMEALNHLEQNDTEGAEQALNEGLGVLGKGQGSDSELQGLYEGLRAAFNALEQRIKDQPDIG